MWELKLTITEETMFREWSIRAVETYEDRAWSSIFTASLAYTRESLENEFIFYAYRMAQWRISGSNGNQPELHGLINLADYRETIRATWSTGPLRWHDGTEA